MVSIFVRNATSPVKIQGPGMMSFTGEVISQVYLLQLIRKLEIIVVLLDIPHIIQEQAGIITQVIQSIIHVLSFEPMKVKRVYVLIKGLTGRIHCGRTT